MDEGSSIDALTWYEDSDSDTFGNASVSKPSCAQPSGYVSDNTDCDDSLDSIYPGAGSSETLLVILAFIVWIGWHVLTAKSESDELERLARKRHGPNDHKSNITDW